VISPLASPPVSLVLHGDVIDPWCWLAEKRVLLAADAFHSRFAAVEHAALPRRWEARVPTAAERRRLAAELRRAARQPDAPPFSPELWIANETGPQSSAPALLAIAAARLQGPAAARALRAALREAALVTGLDVSRHDIIIEVASRIGLDLARFVPAFQAPATERALLDDIYAAWELGIESGPALVIGEAWLVSGLRPLEEYRTLLKRYLARRAWPRVEHTLH
jgi:predicted DsbA family dithiol-disulfide isomerase